MEFISNILNSKKNNIIYNKPLPIKLTLALTFLCNSKCKTCEIWKIYKENPDKYKEELRFYEWKRLFDEIGDNLCWVEFTGGEALLKKDVVDIITYAYINTSIFAGGLTTNAVSPKTSYKKIKEILEKIPDKKILNIGISLDGIPEVHDKIRGIEGNFEKAIYLFNELKQLKQQYKNLNIHFAYTISQYNAGRFEEFYKFVKNNYGISIDKITITFEHFTGYYVRENNKLNNPYGQFKEDIEKDVRFYINTLKKEKRQKDLFNKIKLTFYNFYLKNILNFTNNPKKMVIPCSSGTYSSYIDPYGNVYPCTQWNFKMGSLKENSFKEIWWGKKAREVRKLIKNGKCPNCWTPCEAQPSWIMNFGLLRGWW